MLGQAGRSNNNTANSFHVAETENPMTALSTQKMFDNLKDMFDFIMQKMDRLESKIDNQSEKLHDHIDDEGDTLNKHSIYLNIIVWLSSIIAVALVGAGVSWAFGLIG